MGMHCIRVPDVGEGVAEAELVEWQVKVGDLVKEDQVVAAIMTDKATVEIPSPVTGKVVSLGAQAGSVIAVGSELLFLDVGGGSAGEPRAAAQPAASKSNGAAATVAREVSAPESAKTHGGAGRAGRDGDRNGAVVGGASPAEPAAPPVPAAPPRAIGDRPTASPSVRRRALEAGIDLRRVSGSGPAGRVVHADLDGLLRGETPEPTPRASAANTSVEEIKVAGVRRMIAQKMSESKRRIAHFTYVEEVDVTDVEKLRQFLNTRFGEQRPKLTLIPFLMQAIVKAVLSFPQMNALYDDEAEIVRRYGGVHIGIATQTSSGLLVPVVRHVEARDLWDCAAEVKRLADQARAGQASRDMLTGSTITITSLGALGGITTTPVINRPEVSIVGVNKQVVRPVWQNGAFVPRTMMNLSASFDHRVIDGYDAAQFIQEIKGLLENPTTMFLDT
ncbi:MAG: dihydrolipoamide acetyltransferase family protein [Pseudomonadota bacterium]